MSRSRAANAYLGAHVADAAALGLHWLYDESRVAALSPRAFRPPDPADFEGAAGVFVHHGKRAGDMSQYGAQLRVCAQSLIGAGGVDPEDHSHRFAEAFGPGGSWTGYVDKATRAILDAIAADRRPHGALEDDQIPGLARLVACAAAGATDIAPLLDATARHEDARAYAPAAMEAMRTAIEGAAPRDAAIAGAAAASGEARAALEAAISSDEPDAARFAGAVGRACPIRFCMPVIFHIAARAGSFAEAVDANIRAAGDSCGRAPILGAIFAAAFGLGSRGMPLDWILTLTNARAIEAEARSLTELAP